MPTNPIPAQPRSGLVGAKTQRINFQSGDKTELEHMQRNIADRLDEVLNFVQSNFAQTAPTKTTGSTAVQAGSSQAAKAVANFVSLKNQPSKVFIAPLIEGFVPAVTLGTNSTTIVTKYKPAGSTVTPTLDYAKAMAPFAGKIVGYDVTAYAVAPTAGTFAVTLYNLTTNKITSLGPALAYNKLAYVASSAGASFNAGDVVAAQVVVAGWAQGSAGGVEVRLWAQT